MQRHTYANPELVGYAAWYTRDDVTSAVSGAGDLTFALVAQSTDGSGFLSRETTSKPQLIITP